MLKVILTSLLSVAALFIITKIMGHKQVSQLDFFDYISGITIGSIAAELATELEAPELPLAALIVYGVVSVTLSLMTQRLPRTRKFINGTPTILMNDGKIYRQNLRRARLDLSEFMILCRMQGYFDLDDIQVAIFEYNGRLSILPRGEKRMLTPSDVGASVAPAHIGTELIMDGRIMGENLVRCGRDEKWLYSKLSELGFKRESDVLLAVYYAHEDRLSVYKKQ